jgi:hypothetical protein
MKSLKPLYPFFVRPCEAAPLKCSELLVNAAVTVTGRLELEIMQVITAGPLQGLAGRNSVIPSEARQRAHGVSISEPKMSISWSTDLKYILKPSVQMYCKMWHFAVHCSNILQYTAVGTPRRQSSAEIEFRHTGHLARGQILEKQPSEVRAGPPLAVKASSSSKIQIWSVTQTEKNKIEWLLINAR